MLDDRIKQAVQEIHEIIKSELLIIETTGEISNYHKLSTRLAVASNKIYALGKMRDIDLEEQKKMKLKLTRQLRTSLLQLAALLLVDASDGQIDDADHVSTLMITTGQEIRRQNGLPPL